MGLEDYRRKRDFSRTREPAGERAEAPAQARLRFVVQQHAARRVHYDFRLELGGVLKSWAVPKGPSLDPHEKRLAVHVEDHPLDYGNFEGAIPPGQYGSGTVQVWDHGYWLPEGDAEAAYRKGHLRFHLFGDKLHGRWSLVRLKRREEAPNEDNWLLLKTDDAYAGTSEVVEDAPHSTLSGRTLEEIRAEPDRYWHSETELPAHVDPFPKALAPQLATLVDQPPNETRWLHEIKFDGYRIVARIHQGKPQLLTRHGLDWTERFGHIAKALTALPVINGWLDGEIAAVQPDGTTDFGQMQNALSEKRDTGLAYFLFDLLYLNGHDLRTQPLRERKQQLQRLISHADTALLRFSDHVEGHGRTFFDQACHMGLEGIVSKRADRPYLPRRSRDWLKAKCLQRQEFVIGGYTAPSGARSGFGALLLGYFRSNGKLAFAGRAGTGFTEHTLNTLYQRLQALTVDRTPFDDTVPAAASETIYWVRPMLVAEVEFSNWTRDGVLRHPSFKGLREDKRPEEVILERPQSLPASPPPIKKPSTEPSRVRLSNPEKLLYPALGLTKQDLAHYYEMVAPRMLPDLKDRPLTLLRCPNGSQQGCFFQKHAAHTVPREIVRVPIREKGLTTEYLAVTSVTGLLGLVQMGVLEIHTWGARRDRPDRPDRLVFDLDPDEGLPLPQLHLAALTMRERLAALGLVSFLKTTGGKGFHVVVPLLRRHDWDEAKAFAKAVADNMVRDEPRRYTARLAKAQRKGKIFIDYLRNSRGATAICNYSTRARPGAPVSVPLDWEELRQQPHPDQYTAQNLRNRLDVLTEDPWATYAAVRQSITQAMKRKVGMKGWHEQD